MDSVRTLTPPEVDATWKAVAQAWDVAPGAVWWFPLAPTTRAGVVALQAAAFHATLGAAWLRDALARRGVERVLHFPEFTELPVVEQPLAQATFRYDRAEGYWCDARAERRDWLIYASHEDSITLGGAWLVDAVQRAWPAWAEHLWGQYPDSYRPAAT